jgi:uncharacterized membrane protein
MMISMRNKSGLRQAFSMVLIVAGALIMLLASESWTGLLFMGLGMLVEILAISINHHD